ncbi:MAG: hypothetical protein AAF741_12520 [Bacteroidota bacterium]
MYLKNRLTNQNTECEILELSRGDLQKIKRDVEFGFDWSTEKWNDTYKLFALSDRDKILGLMSLIDRPDEFRIHLNLLEVTKSQQGDKKTLEGIAGCLIAFAASLAIKKGYGGFVSLEPKTQLIEHYQDKYGFRQYGRYLAIEGAFSISLIDKYLNDD